MVAHLTMYASIESMLRSWYNFDLEVLHYVNLTVDLNKYQGWNLIGEQQ